MCFNLMAVGEKRKCRDMENKREKINKLKICEKLLTLTIGVKV